jgi:PEGA domain
MVTSTSPDGAETYLDDQPVRDINGNISTTPSSITGIITGIHRVTFKKAGYTDTSVTVNIQNGMYSDARATLQLITTRQ